jgi:hypothetical protein
VKSLAATKSVQYALCIRTPKVTDFEKCTRQDRLDLVARHFAFSTNLASVAAFIVSSGIGHNRGMESRVFILPHEASEVFDVPGGRRYHGPNWNYSRCQVAG